MTNEQREEIRQKARELLEEIFGIHQTGGVGESVTISIAKGEAGDMSAYMLDRFGKRWRISELMAAFGESLLYGGAAAGGTQYCNCDARADMMADGETIECSACGARWKAGAAPPAASPQPACHKCGAPATGAGSPDASGLLASQSPRCPKCGSGHIVLNYNLWVDDGKRSQHSAFCRECEYHLTDKSTPADFAQFFPSAAPADTKELAGRISQQIYQQQLLFKSGGLSEGRMAAIIEEELKK